jgi:hypothetical protein
MNKYSSIAAFPINFINLPTINPDGNTYPRSASLVLLEVLVGHEVYPAFIKGFKKEYKLPYDAIIDAKTWDALLWAYMGEYDFSDDCNQ